MHCVATMFHAGVRSVIFMVVVPLLALFTFARAISVASVWLFAASSQVRILSPPPTFTVKV